MDDELLCITNNIGWVRPKRSKKEVFTFVYLWGKCSFEPWDLIEVSRSRNQLVSRHFLCLLGMIPVGFQWKHQLQHQKLAVLWLSFGTETEPLKACTTKSQASLLQIESSSGWGGKSRMNGLWKLITKSPNLRDPIFRQTHIYFVSTEHRQCEFAVCMLKQWCVCVWVFSFTCIELYLPAATFKGIHANSSTCTRTCSDWGSILLAQQVDTLKLSLPSGSHTWLAGNPPTNRHLNINGNIVYAWDIFRCIASFT